MFVDCAISAALNKHSAYFNARRVQIDCTVDKHKPQDSSIDDILTNSSVL